MRTLLALCLMLGLALSASAQSPLFFATKPAPKRGMTRTQVLARYGEPRHRAVLDGAEVWYYRLKFNEVYGRAFVPFEFSSENVSLGQIFFDPTGKVSRFDWSHSRAD